MIKLLRKYLLPYRSWVMIVLVLLFGQALGQLYLPSLNADIINNGVVTGDVGFILRTGGWMLAVSLGAGIAAVVGVYYSSKTSMSFGRDLRAGLFHQGQQFSLREMNQFGAPSLITRNTNDVQQVQMFVQMALTIIVLAPITAVGGVIMAVRQDAELSLTLLVIVPVMVLLVWSIASRAIPLFRAMQVKIDTVNQVLRENLTGIRVIRAFIRTEHEEARFAAANADLTDTTLRVGRLFALLMPALQLVMSLSQVAIVWFGGHRVATDAMPVGNLFAFISYLMQILMSVMMSTMVLMMLPRAAASADRISEVLDTVPAIHDPEVVGSAPDGVAPGLVEFRDVTFGYPGAAEPVLRNVSFRALPGQTTAIVGSTGSGKSTLINLVPRLYDVTDGAVLVNGIDVREQEREKLWAAMGLIPQKAFLFSGTVASNLRFGAPDASDEQLWAALRTAQGEDFVRAMPERFDAPIEQGGTNVSGGQRQRLAIARALVRQPSVYIFDDSFSALDFATDARLRAALAADPAVSTATVLIVAQRVSTIMHAEQILVLDNGRVVGVGTHPELMASSPTYREIVLSQLSEEEAA
ncbi:MAG: ABC transporter ATP-binding protein [Candidatus Nanopelagicales bacterium]